MSKILSRYSFAFTILVLVLSQAINAYANPAIVNLGEAGNFAILSKTAISDVPLSAITGDVGISPAAATLITGLTCPEVTGTGVPFPIHVPSAGGSTIACQTVDPLYLTPTIGNMQAAYSDALSRASDVAMGIDLGGLTLTPGVYTTAFNLGITSDVHLDCGGNTKGVFIFQIAGNLDLSSSTHVVLQNGCQASRIFWAVAGTTTINGGVGTESTFSGTVLAGPATSEITVITGSTVNGRLLGEKTIAIQKNTITMPTDAPDNVLPVVTLNTQNNAWTANNQSSLNFTFVDATSANASCNLFIDGAAYNASLTVNNSTSTLITPNATLAEGAHSWYVNCTDLSGNEGTSTPRLINIDTTAPVVSLVSPANNTGGSNPMPTFTFNYTDASVTASCTLFVGAAALGTNSLVANNTNTAITANASLSQGSNSWYVNCTDQASNAGSSAAQIYTVATVNPSLTVSAVSNAISSHVPFTVNANGTDTAISYASFNIYDNSSNLVSSLIYNTTSGANTAGCTVVDITNVTCSANPFIGGGNFLLNVTVHGAVGASNSSVQYFNLTTLIGNASNINTTLANVAVLINGTNATDGMQFNGAQPVNVTSNALPVVDFNYNFTASPLNFSALTISNGNSSGASYFVVNGVNSTGAQVGTKTIYVYNASISYNGICVQNTENAAVPSATCSGAGEFSLRCNGTTDSHGVTCTKSANYTILTISGLQNSGIIQFIVPASPATVNLGTAGNFAILAKSGISTTGTTSVVGNIGVSPIDSTAITGFGLIMDPSTQFATSSLVTGRVYASDYAAPTPTTMTTAVGDMETAYTDAAGRTLPDYVELGAGNIGGLTLAPGLYKWGTGVTIPTDVTLSGGPTDVWIFQVAGTLDISSGKKVLLSGGAQAKNVFWQVAGQTTLGTTSVFNGNILDQTAVVITTGAALNGRALAQTAVTTDANAVSIVGTTSPSVTLNSPVAGFNTSNTSIAFNFTATDEVASTTNCTLFIDGVSNQTNSSTANNTATTFIVSGFTDGAHNWSVSCTNAAGYLGSSAVPIYTVDTVAPTVVPNAPVGILNAGNNNPTFDWTATDALTSTTCNLSIDGVFNKSVAANNGTPTTTTATSSFADGAHNWSVSCWDAAGNLNDSMAVRNFTVVPASAASTSSSSGGNNNGGGSVSGGGTPVSSVQTATYFANCAGGTSSCPVTIKRVISSSTNLSSVTTTLENTGGSNCAMVNFVFTDTIPSSFAAMNEITFSPAYAIRSGWTVAFRFPSFASGESKTLVYSVDKWVGSSKLADFGVYAMSCNVQVSAPPIEPVVTTPVANVSVVKPKPAVPVLQPAVPQPAPVGSSNSLYSAFLAFPWWIVVLFLCIGVLGVTGYWYMSQGNNKKKSAR